MKTSTTGLTVDSWTQTGLDSASSDMLVYTRDISKLKATLRSHSARMQSGKSDIYEYDVHNSTESENQLVKLSSVQIF